MEKGVREEKRERAAHHDSRRYLKKHPRKRSDPLTGLEKDSDWKEAVQAAVKRYPKLRERERADMAAGGLRPGRRGPSPEAVLIRHSSGLVEAVEKAMKETPAEQREKLRELLWGGRSQGKEDRPLVERFYKLAAVYLGFGDSYWAVAEKKPGKGRGR